MKYIDVDKLKEKITEQIKSLPREVGRGAGTLTSKGYGMMEAFQIMRSIIDSLQQEPLIHTELCTLIACDVIQATAKRAIEKPQDKDKEEDLMIKKMEYLNMLEKSFFQQEQPEADLEKAARHVYESWMGGTIYDVRRDMVELDKVLNERKEK